MELLDANCNPASTNHPCTTRLQSKYANHKQLLLEVFRTVAVMQIIPTRGRALGKLKVFSGTSHTKTDNNVTDLEDMSVIWYEQ